MATSARDRALIKEIVKAVRAAMPAPSERMIRLPELRGLVGMSTTTIYARMAAGDFPRPVQMGAQAVAWRESQINAWMRDRPNTVPLAESEAAKVPAKKRKRAA